jgi:hypothetical protein
VNSIEGGMSYSFSEVAGYFTSVINPSTFEQLFALPTQRFTSVYWS